MRVTFKKIIKDLAINKVKSIFIFSTLFLTNVIFSIVIMIGNVLTPEVEKSYFNGNPAEMIIKCEPYNISDLSQLDTISEIEDYQGRAEQKVRLIISEQKYNVTMIVTDPSDNHINRLTSNSGGSELPKLETGELFLERAIKDIIAIKPGDTVQLINENNEVTALVFNDFIYDSISEPYLLEGDIYAYINQETYELLTGDGRFDEILITTDGSRSKEINSKIADQVVEKLGTLGITVDETEVKNTDVFFASQALDGINILLIFMGFLIIIMACTLIINTFNSMMLNQTKTIGVLKSIGGSNFQIFRIYLLQIVIIGLSVYAVSLPVSYQLAKLICCKIGIMFNMSLSYIKMPILLPIVLFISAIIVPLISAGIPISKVVKASVYDSLYLSLRNHTYQTKTLWLKRTKAVPMMGRYIIRNNMKDRIRALLTMLTLMLTACILMTSLNLYKSFKTTIAESRSLFADGIVILKDYYKSDDLMKVVKSVDGISVVETWNFHKALFVESFGKSKSVILSATGEFSFFMNDSLLKDKLIDGELLSNENKNEILINNHLLKLYPDIKVGDTIHIIIAGNEYDFIVVGVLSIFGQPASPTLFVNYPYMNQLLRGPDMVNDIRFNRSSESEKGLDEVLADLETALNKEGIYIAEMNTGDQMFEEFSITADIIVALLLFIAFLMLIVGTIGLAGSLNINLMEHISEFGIIRAIGGSDQQIREYIFGEGLILTGISWIIGNLLSIPLVSVLGNVLGKAIFGIASPFRLGLSCIFIGLVIALSITLIACIIPIHNIKKSVIREMLSYE